MPATDVLSHYLKILQLIGAACSIATLVGGILFAIAVRSFKGWFFQWQNSFEEKLEQKYVTQAVYERDHPTPDPHQALRARI